MTKEPEVKATLNAVESTNPNDARIGIELKNVPIKVENAIERFSIAFEINLATWEKLSEQVGEATADKKLRGKYSSYLAMHQNVPREDAAKKAKEAFP